MLRAVVVGVAVLCYAAALAVTGAAVRLPAPRLSASSSLIPSAPPEPPLAAAPETHPPAAPAGAAPVGADNAQRAAVEALAREQAASRELVEDLRATVAQLQEQLQGRRQPGPAGDPAGRIIARLGGRLFAPGQATLLPADRDLVQGLVLEVRSVPGAIVLVEGHTDSQPVRDDPAQDFRDNEDLSLLRARAVAAVLVEGGVPEQDVRVKGWGDSRPLASNDTEEGRERNRRVEIRILPPPPGR